MKGRKGSAISGSKTDIHPDLTLEKIHNPQDIRRGVLTSFGSRYLPSFSLCWNSIFNYFQIISWFQRVKKKFWIICFNERGFRIQHHVWVWTGKKWVMKSGYNFCSFSGEKEKKKVSTKKARRCKKVNLGDWVKKILNVCANNDSQEDREKEEKILHKIWCGPSTSKQNSCALLG